MPPNLESPTGTKNTESPQNQLVDIEQQLLNLQQNTLRIKRKNDVIIQSFDRRSRSSLSSRGCCGTEGPPQHFVRPQPKPRLLLPKVSQALESSAEIQAKINETLRTCTLQRELHRKRLQELNVHSQQLMETVKPSLTSASSSSPSSLLSRTKQVFREIVNKCSLDTSNNQKDSSSQIKQSHVPFPPRLNYSEKILETANGSNLFERIENANFINSPSRIPPKPKPRKGKQIIAIDAPKEIIESITPNDNIESIAPNVTSESFAPKEANISIPPKEATKSITLKEATKSITVKEATKSIANDSNRHTESISTLDDILRICQTVTDDESTLPSRLVLPESSSYVDSRSPKANIDSDESDSSSSDFGEYIPAPLVVETLTTFTDSDESLKGSRFSKNRKSGSVPRAYRMSQGEELSLQCPPAPVKRLAQRQKLPRPPSPPPPRKLIKRPSLTPELPNFDQQLIRDSKLYEDSLLVPSPQPLNIPEFLQQSEISSDLKMKTSLLGELRVPENQSVSALCSGVPICPLQIPITPWIADEKSIQSSNLKIHSSWKHVNKIQEQYPHLINIDNSIDQEFEFLANIDDSCEQESILPEFQTWDQPQIDKIPIIDEVIQEDAFEIDACKEESPFQREFSKTTALPATHVEIELAVNTNVTPKAALQQTEIECSEIWVRSLDSVDERTHRNSVYSEASRTQPEAEIDENGRKDGMEDVMKSCHANESIKTVLKGNDLNPKVSVGPPPPPAMPLVPIFQNYPRNNQWANLPITPWDNDSGQPSIFDTIRPIGDDKDLDTKFIQDNFKDGHLSPPGTHESDKNVLETDKKSADVKNSSVLPQKRAFAIQIVTKKLKSSADEISSALRSLDVEKLSVDDFQILIQILPKENEIIYLDHKNMDTLCKEDQLMKSLSEIPRASSKLEGMKYILNFNERMSTVISEANCLSRAAESILKSGQFPKIVQVILEVVNKAFVKNSEPLKGFQIDSLQRLANKKSTDGKCSLLHCIINCLEGTFPEALNFYNDFQAIEEASKITERDVSNILEELEKGLKDLEAEITLTKEELDREKRTFLPKVSNFIEKSNKELVDAKESWATALSEVGKAIKYLGMSKKQSTDDSMNTQDFFKIILNFVNDYKKALSQNEKLFQPHSNCVQKWNKHGQFGSMQDLKSAENNSVVYRKKIQEVEKPSNGPLRRRSLGFNLLELEKESGQSSDFINTVVTVSTSSPRARRRRSSKFYDPANCINISKRGPTENNVTSMRERF